MAIKKFFVGLTTVVYVSCSVSVDARGGKGSFTKKLMNSAEQAIQALKNNPKCIETIDQIIETSSEKIEVAYKNIINSISENELKQAYRVCENEIKQSFQVVSQTIHQESATVEQNVRQAFGERNRQIIKNELNTCVESIETNIDVSENKELFKQLDNDMRPAVMLAKQAFEDLQENLSQGLLK